MNLISALAPKAVSSKKILFPAVLNLKEVDDFLLPALDDVVELDLRCNNKLQSTLSAPYMAAYAVSPLILDLPFAPGSTVPETEQRKLQILNQLIVDPLVVSKVLGSSEAEPYQLSALRDEDRSFFYESREGFQDLHNYVDSSIELLEPKASSDAAAAALLSYLRQTPAFLALDWIESPKQRAVNHDLADIYVTSGLLSTSNVLLTEMASRKGVPPENLD